MLIIDDLLLAPFALSELYIELETGRIDEAEFDAREAELLDALDRLQESSQDGE